MDDEDEVDEGGEDFFFSLLAIKPARLHPRPFFRLASTGPDVRISAISSG